MPIMKVAHIHTQQTCTLKATHSHTLKHTVQIRIEMQSNRTGVCVYVCFTIWVLLHLATNFVMYFLVFGAVVVRLRAHVCVCISFCFIREMIILLLVYLCRK